MEMLQVGRKFKTLQIQNFRFSVTIALSSQMLLFAQYGLHTILD